MIANIREFKEKRRRIVEFITPEQAQKMREEYEVYLDVSDDDLQLYDDVIVMKYGRCTRIIPHISTHPL